MSNIEQAFKNEDVEPFIIFLMVRSLKDHLPWVDYESNIHDANDDEKKGSALLLLFQRIRLHSVLQLLKMYAHT